mgnify:CR=1 FL=1
MNNSYQVVNTKYRHKAGKFYQLLILLVAELGRIQEIQRRLFFEKNQKIDLTPDLAHS